MVRILNALSTCPDSHLLYKYLLPFVFFSWSNIGDKACNRRTTGHENQQDPCYHLRGNQPPSLQKLAWVQPIIFIYSIFTVHFIFSMQR